MHIWTQYTGRCNYNAVNYLQNPHNGQPIASPWVPGLGCLLYVEGLIHVLLLSLNCRKWHKDGFEHDITTLVFMIITAHFPRVVYSFFVCIGPRFLSYEFQIKKLGPSKYVGEHLAQVSWVDWCTNGMAIVRKIVLSLQWDFIYW